MKNLTTSERIFKLFIHTIIIVVCLNLLIFIVANGLLDISYPGKLIHGILILIHFCIVFLLILNIRKYL